MLPSVLASSPVHSLNHKNHCVGIPYRFSSIENRSSGFKNASGVVSTRAAESATLSPFTTRYLAESGGRWGGTTTRTQNYGISQTLESRGFTITNGGGIRPEEFIKGAGPGSKGGTFVDITSTAANGRTVRIQTIDTLANGLPTPAEAAAAARIRAARPLDKLILVPKGK
jgi:filamentous hemagglutinin